MVPVFDCQWHKKVVEKRFLKKQIPLHFALAADNLDKDYAFLQTL